MKKRLIFQVLATLAAANISLSGELPLPSSQFDRVVIPNQFSADRITPPPSGPITLDAEFDSCEGVFIRYPYGFGANLFADIVDAVQDVAVVYIVTSSQTNKTNCLNYLASHGVPDQNLEFIIAPTNSVWIKDYGPWFVRQQDSTLGIIDMPYAWNPSWTNDDHFPEFLEPYWGMDYYGPNLWHDGGNMMTDGHGTMMMTTYINDRNPGMTNAQICQIYHDYFGQDTCYIFQRISIDLTGHIDLWAKMMNDTTILVAQMQPNDPNYNLIENHAARMATIPTVYGTPFHIVRCPMPPASSYYKSYLNSLLINHRALVPIYNLSYDAAALDSYRVALGPDWDVIGIDCNSIAFAGGAIHCTTQSVPHHAWDYLVNAGLNLDPVSPPIIIPANGGSFNSAAQVQNLDPHAIQFDFWTEVRLPNGNLISPLFKREGLTLAASAAITRTLTQFVPATAPSGTYTYRACIGSWLPRVISQADSFQFVKTGVTMDDSGAEEWACAEEVMGFQPTAFNLIEVYPNPFNPTTTIQFQLQAYSRIRLQVYDTAGRLVATLANGWREAGAHSLTFDGGNLASGMYFLKLESGKYSTGVKLMLLK